MGHESCELLGVLQAIYNAHFLPFFNKKIIHFLLSTAPTL